MSEAIEHGRKLASGFATSPGAAMPPLSVVVLDDPALKFTASACTRPKPTHAATARHSVAARFERCRIECFGGTD